MKKNNLLIVVLALLIQCYAQGQTKDVYSDVADVNSDVVASNDNSNSSQLSNKASEAPKKVLSKKEQKELEEKEQLEREAKIYAAEQAVMRKLSFIDANQLAVITKVSTYNSSLEACRCGKAISPTYELTKDDLANKNMREIRAYYIDKNISIAQIYLESLNNCRK